MFGALQLLAQFRFEGGALVADFGALALAGVGEPFEGARQQHRAADEWRSRRHHRQYHGRADQVGGGAGAGSSHHAAHQRHIGGGFGAVGQPRADAQTRHQAGQRGMVLALEHRHLPQSHAGLEQPQVFLQQVHRLLLAPHDAVEPAPHLLAELVAADALPHLVLFPLVGGQAVGDGQFNGVAGIVHGVVDFLGQQAPLVGDALLDQHQPLHYLAFHFVGSGHQGGGDRLVQSHLPRLVQVRGDVLQDHRGGGAHQRMQLRVVDVARLIVARMFDQHRLAGAAAEIGYRVGQRTPAHQAPRLLAQVGQQALLLGGRQALEVLGRQAHRQGLGQPLGQRPGIAAVQRQQRNRHGQRIFARGLVYRGCAAGQGRKGPVHVDAGLDGVEHQRGEDGR